MDATTRSIEVLNRGIGWVPMGVLVVLLTQAAYMRHALGRWPVVYRDDAPGVIGSLLDGATIVGVDLLLLGVPTWCATMAMLWARRAPDVGLQRVLLFLVPLLLLVFLVVLNPFRFPEWWMD